MRKWITDQNNPLIMYNSTREIILSPLLHDQPRLPFLGLLYVFMLMNTALNLLTITHYNVTCKL